MTLLVRIDMDNAAFDGRGKVSETCRILRVLIDKIHRDGIQEGYDWKLMDLNGNATGKAEVIGEDDNDDE